jgi:hypothetical protein
MSGDGLLYGALPPIRRTLLFMVEIKVGYARVSTDEQDLTV